METYIVNGKEVQHDTFDLEQMELLDGEILRVSEAAESVDSSSLSGTNYIGIIRAQCENVMDAFDTVLGEGTSEYLFGGKVNAKEILHAWRQFVADVMKQRSNIAGDATDSAASAVLNREQRRALERERRRAEAKQRAQAKAENNVC